jgi:hypothetical protein
VGCGVEDDRSRAAVKDEQDVPGRNGPGGALSVGSKRESRQCRKTRLERPRLGDDGRALATLAALLAMVAARVT